MEQSVNDDKIKNYSNLLVSASVATIATGHVRTLVELVKDDGAKRAAVLILSMLETLTDGICDLGEAAEKELKQ